MVAINFWTVMKAAKEQLENYPGCTGYNIELEPPWLKDVALCPWVGLYMTQALYERVGIGGNAPYECKLSIELVIAEYSMELNDASIKREVAVKNVHDALATDWTFSSNVLTSDIESVTFEVSAEKGFMVTARMVLRCYLRV